MVSVLGALVSGFVWFTAVLPTVGASLQSFEDSRWVQRDAARWQEICLSGKDITTKGVDPRLRYIRDLEESYSKLDRVLVIDAARQDSFGHGIGNYIGDYPGWLIWGVLTKRAVFFRWTDCEGLSVATGKKCTEFDLGDWFQGHNETSWSWTWESRERVTAALGAPAEFVLRCPQDLTTPAALQALLEGDHPWVTIDISEGVGLMPLPGDDGEENRRFTDLVLGEAYKRLLGDAKIRLPRPDRRAPGIHKRNGARFFLDMDPVDFAMVEGQNGVHLRGCLLHWLLHPRPRLQEALLPVLSQIDPMDGLIAMHVRSFYADILIRQDQDLPGDSVEALKKALPEWFRSHFLSWGAREGAAAAQQQWAALNEVLTHGGFTRTNSDALLQRCTPGHREFDHVIVGEAGGTGLDPYLTCAARGAMLAARIREQHRSAHHSNSTHPATHRRLLGSLGHSHPHHHHPAQGEPAWGIYMATDAPLLLHLLPQLPVLQGHLVHGCGERPLAECNVGLHAALHNLRQEKLRARRSEEEQREWRLAGQQQIAVDGYMFGLADRLLPVTASTFPGFGYRSFGFTPMNLRQMMDGDDDGFMLQGGGKAFSNKRIPLCEGLGLDFDSGECVAAYRTMLSVPPDYS